MWRLLGDDTKGLPGTYYYRGTEHKVFFWNVFDQVLIRPDLLDRFRGDDLAILHSDGENSFLSAKGLPHLSDHLPLYFKLDL